MLTSDVYWPAAPLVSLGNYVLWVLGGSAKGTPGFGHKDRHFFYRSCGPTRKLLCEFLENSVITQCSVETVGLGQKNLLWGAWGFLVLCYTWDLHFSGQLLFCHVLQLELLVNTIGLFI
jgi:hypothetical protein